MARFQADLERSAREKAAGMDNEPPDDCRRLRNRVGQPCGAARARARGRFSSCAAALLRIASLGLQAC